METSTLLWIQNHIRNPFLTPIMKAASTLGDHGILWIAIILFLLLAAGVSATKNNQTGHAENPFLRPALVCLFSLLICFLTGNLLLKYSINRTRPYDRIPDLIVLAKKPHDPSFPSGHSSISFAVATGLYLTIPEKQRGIAICFLILAALIALSRVYVGVHYPTDILAGSALGILCAFIARKAVDQKLKPVR